MSRKKSKSTQAKFALQRLLEDEQVQKQLRTGAQSLREAYARASRRPSRAAEDKKVYSKLQEAGSSFSSAARRLRRKPEPPKRTGRKLVLGGALAGAAAFFVKKKKGSADEAAYSPPPVATTPSQAPVATQTDNQPGSSTPVAAA